MRSFASFHFAQDDVSLKKLIAFSLVELMISLITISCIAAAFTPVITKKLKKQDIALSIAQTSEITTKCHKGEAYPFGNDTDGYKCELCTKTYCINCELTCPDTKYADPQSCTCKNCSENKTVVPDGCEDCKKCINCVKDKCIKCEVGYYLEGLDGKTYSTCKKCGKTNNKNNICIDGITEKSPDYCENPPVGSYCNGDKLDLCINKYQSVCTSCNSTQCTSCRYNYYIGPSKTCERCASYCDVCTSPTHCTGCTYTLLLDTNDYTCYPQNTCRTKVEHCWHCNGTLTNPYCTECDSGYYRQSDGKKCIACTTLPNCKFCNNNGICTKCNDGYNVNSTGKGCVKCSVENCAVCNSNSKCISCNSGYYLKDNVCVANDNTFTCSDKNFMKIGNLCITRRNMGDNSILKLSPNVTSVNYGEHCYADTVKCCWKSSPTGCITYNGSTYDGCGRTVCNWLAANDICKNFNYAGKTWRLATTSEMANWFEYSSGLGSNGLELCSESSLNLSTVCSGGSCPGESRGGCEPYYFWGQEALDLAGWQYRTYRLSAGWNATSNSLNYAGSVRCVTEME